MSELICESHLRNGETNPVWLEERMKGVTATDAAKLLGHGSPMALWSKKTGRTPPEDLSDLEFVHFGNVLEPVIVEQYASERYANRVTHRMNVLTRSTEHPWMQATLDAVTEHPELGEIPLEVKNQSQWRENAWEDGAPVNFLWQARHQAVVEGSKGTSIACLMGGNRLLWTDEALSKAHAEIAMRVTEEFWWHVTNDIPPTEMDALAETRKALALAFVPDGDETRIMGAGYVELDEEYGAIVADLSKRRELAKAIEDRKKEIENIFKRTMETASEARLDNGSLWRVKRVERKAQGPSSFDRISRKAAKR